jgi:hypothetical protein
MNFTVQTKRHRAMAIPAAALSGILEQPLFRFRQGFKFVSFHIDQFFIADPADRAFFQHKHLCAGRGQTTVNVKTSSGDGERKLTDFLQPGGDVSHWKRK